ncbi:MAG: thioesterase family protein [Acidimicrobiia bacterium]|nr:thioesterase family protein [Acidimicrobiia bacterium]MDH5237031.1 thioesterase family protein [Acidimicrobiia bacterium]
MRLLHDHLAVRPEGSGWALTADRTWWGHNALFGGYAQAMVLAGMQAELARAAPAGTVPMPVRSMSMQFVRPFQDGPNGMSVEIVRQGRSMANVLARAEAGGKIMGLAIANFGTERDVESSRFVPTDRPDVAAIGSGERPTASMVGVPTHELFDFFPRIGALTPGEQLADRAEAGGWVRPRFESPIDEMLLTVLADLWMPATYRRWTHPMVAVSVDITLHFREPLPVDLAPGTPLLVLLVTRQCSRGMVDEDAEVWTPDGRLLLQSRQTRYVTEMLSPIGLSEGDRFRPAGSG